MTHIADQAVQRLRIAGHFHADVEPFFHIQGFLHIFNTFFADIHGTGNADLFGERQPVGVDVGNDHIAGTGVFGDGRRHDADGAGAGDQHIFAEHAE